MWCVFEVVGCVSSWMKDCTQSSVCRSAHWTPRHFTTTHPSCPASAHESYKAFPQCCAATWSGNDYQTYPSTCGLLSPRWIVLNLLVEVSSWALDRSNWVCVDGGGLAPSAPIEQKRALTSPATASSMGCTYLKTFSSGHALIEGGSRKEKKLLLTTSGDTRGQIYRHSCVWWL